MTIRIALSVRFYSVVSLHSVTNMSSKYPIFLADRYSCLHTNQYPKASFYGQFELDMVT